MAKTLFAYTDDNDSIELVETGENSYTITENGTSTDYKVNDLWFYQVSDRTAGGRLLGQYINQHFHAPETVGALDNAVDSQDNGSLLAPGAGNPNNVGLTGQRLERPVFTESPVSDTPAPEAPVEEVKAEDSDKA